MNQSKKGRERRPFRIGRVFLGLILALVICAACAVLALTLTEYKPQESELKRNEIPESAPKLSQGASLTVLSYNTGYAALGENADFFLDGGTSTRPGSKDTVLDNLAGITAEIKQSGADIVLLQEVDTGSKRSYNVNEAERFAAELAGMASSFALNYKSAYVPYPFPETIGKVSSGLATFLKYPSQSSERVQLPVPFSWPMRCFNLKRCLLIDRIPIEGSKSELVVVNLHLEAYDSGEGKIAQTRRLYQLLEEESEKGNYVIVGGDFNQTFPGAVLFPAVKEGNWMPMVVEDTLPAGCRFAVDGQTPTCRLLDEPLKGNQNPQYYIIDGFIVSSNVIVDSVETVETGFVYSDHQPVKLAITLG